jgi:hypothetical protein
MFPGRGPILQWGIKKGEAQSFSVQEAGVTAFDDERHSVASAEANPDTLRLPRVEAQALRRALEAFPLEFREGII